MPQKGFIAVKSAFCPRSAHKGLFCAQKVLFCPRKGCFAPKVPKKWCFAPKRAVLPQKGLFCPRKGCFAPKVPQNCFLPQKRLFCAKKGSFSKNKTPFNIFPKPTSHHRARLRQKLARRRPIRRRRTPRIPSKTRFNQRRLPPRSQKVHGRLHRILRTRSKFVERTSASQAHIRTGNKPHVADHSKQVRAYTSSAETEYVRGGYDSEVKIFGC